MSYSLIRPIGKISPMLVYHACRSECIGALISDWTSYIAVILRDFAWNQIARVNHVFKCAFEENRSHLHYKPMMIYVIHGVVCGVIVRYCSIPFIFQTGYHSATEVTLKNMGEWKNESARNCRCNHCKPKHYANMYIFKVMVCIFLDDDLIKWKHFPRYWPFVWGIHRLLVNSPHTKANNAELWCFLWSTSEQTVELTIITPVIWNAIALIMPSL